MKKQPNIPVFNVMLLAIYLVTIVSCQPRATKVQVAASANFRFEEQDIQHIQQGYKDGTFTIKEVVQAYLNRIDSVDKHGPKLNAIIQINPDALQIAEELDKEMKEGKSRGPLHGIPVVLKDNIDTHDKMATTAGSRALRNSFPLNDSFLAKRLREAGAIIIGKSNLSEWANFRGQLSTSGWSGAGGQTKNPYDISRNPCGSSSGSAVAVAANLTMVAIGTETDGYRMSFANQRDCRNQTNGWTCKPFGRDPHFVYAGYAWSYDPHGA